LLHIEGTTSLPDCGQGPRSTTIKERNEEEEEDEGESEPLQDITGAAGGACSGGCTEGGVMRKTMIVPRLRISVLIAAALVSIALILVASGKSAVAFTSLVNGNFETGDLKGWTVGTTASGETASAVTSYAVADPNQYCEWDCPPRYLYATPHEGSYFALLKVADQSQGATISQPFTASNGDRISGWVFTLETLYQTSYNSSYFDDKGQVVLTDGSGTTIVAPLFEASGSSATADASSPWRYWEYTFTDLPGEGQFQIQAKQSSPPWSGEPNVLGLDDMKISKVSVAPSAPKITTPKNNAYDNDGSFSVSGSAERGSTVELFEGTTSKGTAKAVYNKADSSTGAWSIDLGKLSKVSDGTHTYTAKATNAAGTSNASSPVSITVDTVKPSAPTIDSPKDNSTDTDGLISFDGYTEKESTVKVYQDGATTPAGQNFSASNYAGWWQISLYGVSEQSTAHTFDVTATDAAGNESAKKTVHVTVDKTDRTAPTLLGAGPSNGTTKVERTSCPVVTFSEEMDPKTIVTTPKDPTNPNVGTSTTFTLVKYGTTTPIGATIQLYEPQNMGTTQMVGLCPSSNLASNTKYTGKIKGGTNGVKDPADNQLAGGNQASGDYWWSFTTGSR
jgi:hypothetical protein